LASAGNFRLKCGAKSSGIIVRRRGKIICKHLRCGHTLATRSHGHSWYPTLESKNDSRMGQPFFMDESRVGQPPKAEDQDKKKTAGLGSWFPGLNSETWTARSSRCDERGTVWQSSSQFFVADERATCGRTYPRSPKASDCLYCQGKISWWSAFPGVFGGMAIFPPDVG
jgi:hypothetical protein